VRVRKQRRFSLHTAGRVGSMTRLVHKLQTWNSIKAKQSQPLSRKEIGESTEVAPSLNRYVVESRTQLVDSNSQQHLDLKQCIVDKRCEMSSIP